MPYTVHVKPSEIGLVGNTYRVLDEHGWLVKLFTEWNKQDAYDMCDRLNSESDMGFVDVGGMTYDQVRRAGRE